MYADPNVRRAYPTTAHRRHARRRRRRGIFIPAPLLLILPLVILLLVVSQNTEKQVTALEKPSTSEKINLFFDWEEPRIEGITNLYTYAGDSLSYLDTVTTSDNKDPSPELTVDDSQVNLTYPGIYPIYYIAEDASGNETTTSATVTVMEKQEGYVDTATIYAAIDAQLDKIMLSEMSQYEQIQAIYQWTRGYLMYADSSNHTDWHQIGYEMLTTGTGDCFGYYAVVKLMLERLGIPNIDVRKVKNSENDSDHFWSLVSLDSGETFYHLDTTPRIGEGDHFLLVSDQFLDEYSQAHGRCHNRDVSLYPATPEENYGA